MASRGVPASRREGERGPVAGAAGTGTSPFSKMWAAINPFASQPQGASAGDRAPAGQEKRAGLRSGGQAVYGTLSAERTRGNIRRRRQPEAPADGQGLSVSGSLTSFDRPQHEEDVESYTACNSSVWTEPRCGGEDILATIPMEMTMMPQSHGDVLSPGGFEWHMTKRATSTPREATGVREPTFDERGEPTPAADKNR